MEGFIEWVGTADGFFFFNMEWNKLLGLKLMCCSVQDAASCERTDLCDTVQTDAAHYVVPPPPSVHIGGEAPTAGGRVTGWSSTPPFSCSQVQFYFFGDSVKLSETELEMCSHWSAAAAMEGTTTQPDAALNWTGIRFFFLKGSHQPWGVSCLLCSCWSLRDTFLEVRLQRREEKKFCYVLCVNNWKNCEMNSGDVAFEEVKF